MRIYFSGIGGVGLGPLALIARDMGHDVLGSDSVSSRYTDSMSRKKVPIHIGQDDDNLHAAHQEKPIDWFVYTSALPPDHPELKVANDLGLRTSKRDELLNELISQKGLKLIAAAGTHGKTTTAAMLVWCLKQLDEPVSYSVGTNLSFGESGHYDLKSRYFVYEADEFDRNFLQFKPYASVISAVDYDHADTYPTADDYKQAFADFVASSHCCYMLSQDAEHIKPPSSGCTHVFGAETDLSQIKLAGEHNRRNGYLAAQCVKDILGETLENAITALNSFPGTERRFEKLADNLYTDYAHHPAEIRATLQLARELNKHVVAVYQPHQNLRQHQIQNQYGDCFAGAEQVYWMPTYLSREDESLKVLEPEDLISQLADPRLARPAEMGAELKQIINSQAAEGKLVVLMSAGDLDDWARDNLT